MIHLNKLTLTTITLLSLAVALPVNDVIAQERLVFKVSAECPSENILNPLNRL
jgi:hypothetical protein